jgi:hypothetical protein
MSKTNELTFIDEKHAGREYTILVRMRLQKFGRIRVWRGQAEGLVSS